MNTSARAWLRATSWQKEQMTKKTSACIQMFADKGADNIYATVVAKLQGRVGANLAMEDAKQTCVHIVAGKDGTAYAGLHQRKGAVLLNIRLQGASVQESLPLRGLADLDVGCRRPDPRVARKCGPSGISQLKK
jgi:hypothetical protein